MAGVEGPEEGAVLSAGWGPDLTTVARRLATPDLLDAIWDPSRVVAERFRNTIVVTHGEIVLEGRIVAEDSQQLELIDSAGRRAAIALEDIAVRELSDLSPMPAGLLADRSLEEIKDLLAYLDAEGVTDGSPAAWQELLADVDSWSLDEPWLLERGVLEGRAVGLPHNSYAWREVAVTDFELEVDLLLHANPGANSGLQYRSTWLDELGARPDPAGYQVDAGTRVFGSLYATDGRGELARGPFEGIEEGSWNHLHLRVEGDRHQVEWNGRPCIDTRDSSLTGRILGLQLHERTDMIVRAANLRLRPLR